MQYETIILEMLTRIKKLEEDVATLKAQSVALPISGEDSDIQHEGEATTYRKMTDEMIEICYRYGKKAAVGESIQELADDISETTGMNRNSAVMYLYAVQGMLAGTIYKRAISAKALKKYYDLIWNEYGSAGLKRAIQATRLHIDYRRECGHVVDSIEEICDRYANRF